MKRFMRFAILISIFTVSLVSSPAQITTSYPLHEGVKHGVLSNGMNYYVLHNEEPKETASFFFVQNVGAILEEDSQNGLAHFLEHMAFNGTKHFEGKGIIDFLEQHGVRFGYDINAYTAHDQTVYNLSNIPITAGDQLLDSCLLVMHDWSGYLLLNPDEIEAERGVIREEWRTRRNAQFRLNAQTSKVIFHGSKYAERDVIGDLDVINNFEHQELKDYYSTWYRPDQQAVVVVGDINVEEVEQKIIDLFSRIPLKQNLPERPYFNIPDNEELLFGKATDPEAQIMALMLFYKSAVPKIQNEESNKAELIQNCYAIMANQRLGEFQQNPESNTLVAQTAFMPMTKLHQGFVIQVIPKPGKGTESFEEVYIMVENIKRFGFNESELSRVKDQLRSQFDNFLQNKDKITHDNWATQLGNHFLQGEPVFTPEKEHELSMALIDAVTLDEVNQFASKVQTEHNRALLVTGPEKEGQVYPSQDELVAIIDKVEASTIQAYEDVSSDEPLVPNELVSGQVSSAFSVAGIDQAKGYILDNGARVVLMKTDFPEDQILFTAYSPGGQSLIPVADLPSADISTGLATYSGLGSFDMLSLQKKLAGKIASSNPYIANLYEGLSGSSNQKDFETLLQLSYLRFTAPRFDEKSFQVLLNQMETVLENKASDNTQTMQDTIALLSSNYHPRTLLFTKELIEKTDFDKAQSIYLERFKNIGDFTFIITGKLPDNALELTLKYIGSIEGNSDKESYVNHNIRPAKGKTVNHFSRDMEVPKTAVYTQLVADMNHDPRTALVASILGKLLDKRYMETIREEEGGSYGVSVSSSLSRLPVGRFYLTISFDTDPDKKERLMEIVWQEINNIMKNGPSASDLEEIKKSLIKLRKEQLEKNGYWHGALQTTLKSGNPYISMDEYEKIVNGITPKDLRKLTKKAIKKADVVEVLMNPANQ